MKKPLVSCVCVTYNRPHLLNELLYSFLMQDYENKELIIVNDQTDVKYCFDDHRVRIYNLDKRFSSLGEKRNYSKSLIKGDYMITMDDDDIYYSKHISNHIKFHLEHPEYDIVVNSKTHFSVSNDNVSVSDTVVPFNAACIKKEYVENNEFPKEKSCGEDQDFIRNAKVGDFNKEPTFHYRWGLDICHISGRGSDGVESYKIISRDTPIGKTHTINLESKISEKVKLYYK